jgi:hypothetical protein
MKAFGTLVLAVGSTVFGFAVYGVFFATPYDPSDPNQQCVEEVRAPGSTITLITPAPCNKPGARYWSEVRRGD